MKTSRTTRNTGGGNDHTSGGDNIRVERGRSDNDSTGGTCEYELRWQRIGWDNRSLWMSGLFARDSGQNGFGQGKVDWL